MRCFLRACCLTLVCLLLAKFFAFGQFETRARVTVSGSPHSIAVGDFNRDGVKDLAVLAFTGGQVAILLGKGDGTFLKPSYYDAVASSLATADLRNNGILDLILTDNLSDNVQVLLGNGDGTFGPPAFYPTPNFPNVIGIGDFNNDGKLDVVTVDQSGICPCISILLGNGDGTFQEPPIITMPPDPAAAIGLGDFNRDGKLDIVTVGQFGSANQIGILLGNGDGTFTPGETYQAGNAPQSVAVAAFNHDGKLDLAVANPIGGSIEILLGNGNGTFEYGQVLPGSFPAAVHAADFTGDGKLDLVYVTGVLSTVMNLRVGNGDGTFGAARSFTYGNEMADPATGDFNGDGQTDLIVLDYLGNGVVTWLNTGVVSFSPIAPLNFPQQLIGTTSAPQTVTLTNNGKVALTISSITHSGQFGLTNTCGSTVAPHAHCTLTATFSPQSVGPKTGLISIKDSASSKPQVIELSGAGTVVELSPATLTFAAQTVGTTSAPQQAKLTNTGTTPLTISKVFVNGNDGNDFPESNNCPSSLGAGTSCIVTVKFSPKKTGTRTATVSVNDNGGSSPQVIALSGTGD